MELENVKQDDVKDEAKEKHFKPELLDLEEAPLGRQGSCWFKVEVVNEEKNGVWKHHKEIFGEYKLESAFGINNKPHYISTFKSGKQAGKYGIWYDNNGRLTIGLSSNLATTEALAYVTPQDLKVNDYCPYDPAYTWRYKKGNMFLEAGEGLTIRCKGCGYLV
jgi:hypothetical protein